MNVNLMTSGDDGLLRKLNFLAQLEDGVSVPTKDAATFLARSESLLAHWRQHGGGPEYQQPMNSDSSARNNRVTYLMRALRDWQSKNTVRSSMQAAERRSLTFVTLADLQRPEPFWKSNRADSLGIIGHALAITSRGFDELFADEKTELVWESLDEVLQQQWADLAQREIFDNAFADVVNALVQRNSHNRREDRLRAIAKSETSKDGGASLDKV